MGKSGILPGNVKSLSPDQARKLVLHSQLLPSVKWKGRAAEATLSAIEHLGYIQIDTISAVQRAHHHTLWNRNPRYKQAHLDQLVENKQVFEYWSHAAAYMPMRDFRFSLPRKLAMARGEQEHWFARDHKMMQLVLDRIRNEGPLMAKDFEHRGHKIGEWDSKPAKRALENLFMQGELMAPRRKNFQKVYDLTERVLPDGIDTSVPGSGVYARFLIQSFLRTNGLGQASEMAYLRKNTRSPIVTALDEMVEAGEVIPVHAGDTLYYALPGSLALLNKPLARSRAKILSPFDNLLIQRKRIQTLFNFDYQIECYLPADKRQYGYFSLPVLWDGKLVARMDCKADRKRSLFHIHNLVLEEGLRKRDAFGSALCRELELFLKFNNCTYLLLHRTSPPGFLYQLLSLFDHTFLFQKP